MNNSYIPRSNRAEWHITYTCNLKCTHCNRLSFLPTQTPDMSLNNAEEFCNQSNNLKWKPKIVIVGGEPTLHPQFFEFLKIAINFTGDSNEIEVWSNGYSAKSKKILEKVKDQQLAVVADGTIKNNGSIIQPANDLYLAPIDFGMNYRLPCWCHAKELCGISVDSIGYTLCASGGAIDSFLKKGLRTKNLLNLFNEDWAKQHTDDLCKLCGHALGISKEKENNSKIICGSRMSKTWIDAIQPLIK
jgi:hypothetical protein